MILPEFKIPEAMTQLIGGGVYGQEVAERMILFQLWKKSRPYFLLILPKSFINTELFPFDCFSSQRETSV